ncbi:MAG TPA: TonB-dependent receptor plug domain-containing protein, partial [Chitinophagaceae bacterium]|nr:TonB-dependent receptor plug domain-containing protein [Chitinophagaceae bacterium]
MKLTALLLLATCLAASAKTFSQRITLHEKNASLEKIFKAIKKQTGYTFIYRDELIQQSNKINIDVSDAGIAEVLDACFTNQPFTYEIIDKTIVVKQKFKSGITNPDEGSTKRALVASEITVKGRITNEAGEPVQASILVKGTQNGTSSNAEGYYELKNVDEKATLVITGVGIEPQEIRVNSRVTIYVAARIAVKEGDEVVVAYGRQKQQAITGSVTVVKGEQIQNLPNRSFDKSLQGLVPGLLVTPGTGQPGGGTSNFLLRGIATSVGVERGSMVRNPLIVIDGVPVSQDPIDMYFVEAYAPVSNPLAQLNPGDIESITVLKDASAIALYGAQSSNGVIIVTTKKGKAGKTQFSFRHQTDIAGATKLPDVLSQQEYLELLYETYKNTSGAWTDATILADLKTIFPTRSDGSFYPAPDWIGELFNKKATTFSNQLSASGGNDKTTFYLNLEYTKQNGIEKATGFDRKSIRFN